MKKVTAAAAADICFLILTISLVNVCSLQFRPAESTQRVRCIESERQALLKLKVNVYYDYEKKYQINSGDQKECCNWEGITCDNQTSHVVALELQNVFVQDEIGEHLLDLQHVNHLDFSGTRFHNQVPSDTGSLSNLEYLNLSHAIFRGTIPPQIGNLSKLQVLDLSRTYDGDYYSVAFMSFHWLSRLHSLSYLDLSHMDFSNVPNWSETITNLTSLNELHISGSNLRHISTPLSISNSSVSSLAVIDLAGNHLHSSSLFLWLLNFGDTLVHIDLSGNLLSDLLPEEFGKMRYLKYLDLSYNDFQSFDHIRCLANMTSLERLNISHNNLNSFKQTDDSYLPNLEALDISSNQIVGAVPNLTLTPSLRELHLQGNRFDVFPQITKMSFSLEILDVSSNSIVGQVPNLHFLPSLKELKLSNNKFNLFPQFTKQLPNLEILDVSSNSIVEQFPNIDLLPSLKELNLSNNKFNLFTQFTKLLPSLEILDVSSNSIVEHFPNLDLLPSLMVLQLSNNMFNVFPQFTKQFPNLGILDVSRNNINGSILHIPEYFPSLVFLYLHENQFAGTIPEGIGLLVDLLYLDLHSNKLEGIITEVHFSNISNMIVLDLSSNPLLTFKIDSRWNPPFSALYILGLRGVNLGPNFPTWLQKAFPSFFLDISNSQISDAIPSWFWISSYRLDYLNVSNNQIHGNMPRLSSFDNLFILDLSFNRLSGTLPPLPCNLTFLDLSNNGFRGSIFGLCNSLELRYVDLSNNNLLGVLPDCLRKLKDIYVLNLAHNNLSGKIPTAIGAMKQVGSLHLRNNNLFGEIPSFLRNCSKLRVIDFGKNNFSGEVPQWIGESLKSLVVLSLQKNQLRSKIPQNLCYLQHIQILDFSQNKLSGAIPTCLNNLSAMTQRGYNSAVYRFTYEYDFSDSSKVSKAVYDENAFLQWKGKVHEFRNTLGLVTVIDFSSNNLNGSIPSEISSLAGLIGLNLSRNQLVGIIPRKFGKLASLDFLDLSRNKLSGSIPSSLGQLSGLGFLDLSYNNLSGSIPQDNHLQTYSSLAYIGNPELCGKPLLKPCTEDDLTPHKDDQRNGNHDQDEKLVNKGFFISMGIGFVFGFWGICSSLLLSDPWRYSFFKLVNKVEVWSYIKMVLCKAYLRGIFSKGDGIVAPARRVD